MPGVAASTTLQYTGIAVFVAIVLYVVLYYSRSFNSIFLTRRHDANLATGTAGDVAATARPGPVQALGLGPDDVAVLPTFTYHAIATPVVIRGAANAKATTAADCCAVCLEDLREGALVRMLASCNHYFHAECVDVWLLSHATCPVAGAARDRRWSVWEWRGCRRRSRSCAGAGRRCCPRREAARRLRERKDIVSSGSPSPVMRSPMRFEVSTGSGDAAMSP